MLTTNTMSQINSRTIQPTVPEVSECPVCLDPLQPKKTVCPPCAHAICEKCYDGIFQNQLSPSCPLCRASYIGEDSVVVPRLVLTPVRGLSPAVQRPFGLGDERSRFDHVGFGNTLFRQPPPSQRVYNPPVPRREENKEGGNFPSILIACFLFILFEACRHRRRRDRD